MWGHQHIFLQSDQPGMLYCVCGQTKSLHEHKWQENSKISNQRDQVVGMVLFCTKCGDLKNHHIND